jgi:hypothetical protein
MDAQLVAMLTQTIYVAAATGANTHGEPTWGTPASRSVRIELSDRVIKGPRGEELVASHLIITTAAIGLRDRVWLPGDARTDELAKRPKLVEPIPGEYSGVTDHWEVYL